MAFPDGTDDRVQRALNTAKRAELAEKFGGIFIEGDSPLPPDIESEFLQRIEEFELKWASHAITTVRAFIGDPPVKPLAELGDGELAEELEYLMAALEENDIELDFCERPDDAEVYRFITEELLDHEMDDIRVPGMVCHFIYEEFHPNPAADARFTARSFVDGLLVDAERLVERLATASEIDAEGIPIDLEPLRQSVLELRSRIASVLEYDLEATDTSIEGNDARVVLRLRIACLEAGTMNQRAIDGEMRLKLRRGSYDSWEVTAFEMPEGW